VVWNRRLTGEHIQNLDVRHGFTQPVISVRLQHGVVQIMK
jgi:hypothetical protein